MKQEFGSQTGKRRVEALVIEKMKSMRAILYAARLDIRAGYKLQPFANVDVYPLIAHILGLRIGKIDGSIEPVRGMLRKAGGE